jgi:class 3 adenylate cyclase
LRIRPNPGSSGERRQLTALFCDIVEYSRLARLLDEEELHKVIGAYQTTVAGVVTRWGGYVESALGDAVTAFFGFPQAHEDDAKRAVWAGLEIMSAVGAVTSGSDARAHNLTVRIGIHTGVVVVGDLGTGEPGKKQALGPTLNVAARLQAIAQPGTIVISAACQRLVGGLFLTEDLGVRPLKGIEEPVRSYVVLHSTAARDSIEGRPAQAVPLIGREREVGELRGHWEQARGGRGRVVLLSGEAGIGKSRLVRRLRELTASEGPTFEWRCSPFYTARPFHPIIEGLEQHLGITGGTPRDRLITGVRAFLAGSGLSFEDQTALDAAAQLLADLISPGASPGGDRETPTLRRSRTLDLLCNLTRARASDRASVMVMEDLHWADPSTIELLGLLATRCRDVPLLLLFTFRPDFVPPWQNLAGVHTLNVEPLTSQQCAALFDELVGTRPLPPHVREEVLSKGEGVPLFVEELTHTVLATAADQMSSISATPNNLRSLIVSRIDRLSEGAVETVHLASALSREFGFDLLATVSEKSGAVLRRDLDELVRSGLLYRRQAAAETFVFKHALIAEYAYDSILHSDRRRLHARIARRLREAVPAMMTEQPEFLAHHFGEAGDAETAVEYWRRAGDRAIARGALREALSHFENGTRHLPHIENGHVRLHHEIELTVSRGTALFSMLGYAHPEVEAAFAHASSLCEQEGSSPALLVLYGLWAVHLTRNNREALSGLLPRFEELAKSGDPVALMAFHAHVGVFAFLSGDFEGCVTEMTAASRWYHTPEYIAFVKRHGYAGGLYVFAYQAWSMLILGRSQDAQSAAAQLQQLADELGNPYGLAIAGGFLVNFARDRRNASEALALAERQLEYIQRQMLALWEVPVRCGRGWARVHLGQTADGVSEIRQGLKQADLVGLRATYPYHLGGLAEALLAAGDADAALTAATEALRMCQTGLDRFYEAELRRFYGEAQWRLGDLVSAETAFNDAIAIALRQSARLFALRAVMSLARLLVESGRADLARQKLETVLPGVAGGSDLREVEEARELLSAFT